MTGKALCYRTAGLIDNDLFDRGDGIASCRNVPPVIG